MSDTLQASTDNQDLHPAHTIERAERLKKEQEQIKEKRKQPGIGFPSAAVQKHLLIVRLNLALPASNKLNVAKEGLKRLCNLFARIDKEKKKIDVLSDNGKLKSHPLKDFHFSATIGFGIGFFNLLNIPNEKRPKRLREMPDHTGLGDVAPYSLGQTDMIIQLGSSEDFINRWVLENTLQPAESGNDNPEDLVSAIKGWATITDIHAGFQRIDGRNLQGFNDGVSNPRRLSPLFNEVVWTTEADEGPVLKDGTYMVFQKIVHDLDQWRALDVDEQQEWVGRSKGTGLLLGTLSEEEDAQLAKDLHSDDAAIRGAALAKWKSLFTAQSDPQTPFFDHEGGDLNGKPKFGEIPLKCPAWSHVRKANPRQEDGKFDPHLIFRRGYPFMESGLDNRIRSGLLFVCFQRDIANGFEFIKRLWFGNGQFPVPLVRPFSNAELESRHQHGRFSAAELLAIKDNMAARELLGLKTDEAFNDALDEAKNNPLTQQTGREGLAGPSEHGVTPTGEFLAIVPLGGGYYFVPPIPNKNIAEIGQQFF